MIGPDLLVANGDGLGKLIFPLVVMVLYAVISVLGKVLQKGRQQAPGPRAGVGPQPRPPAVNRPDTIDQFLQEVMGERPEPEPPARDGLEVLTRAPQRTPAPSPAVGPARRPPARVGPAPARFEPEPVAGLSDPMPPFGRDLVGDLTRQVEQDVAERVREDLEAADMPPPEQALPDATALELGPARRAPHSGLAALLGAGPMNLRSAMVITEVFGQPLARRHRPFRV